MATTIVDLQAEALVELLVGGINAEIDSGDPAAPTIHKAHAFNLDRARRTTGGLPALLVHRLSERSVRRTTAGPREHVVTWRFEYHLASTSAERHAEATPLLAMVWSALVDLVCAGRHAQVQDNAQILKVAGFMDVEDLGPVNYGQPVEGQDLAPSFVGTIVLRHRTPADLSALQALLSLDAQYRLVGGSGDTALAENEQPLVREILTT